MSTAEERFQAMMAKRKKTKEKVEEKEVSVIEKKEIRKSKDIKEIFQIEDSVFSNLTKDVELIEYLKNKSLEMLKIQGNNVIRLGKNLTEVFEELGRKGSPEGLYIKYLEFNGYKKDTALRLRKRYELFISAKSDTVKQIISILPIRSIEELYRQQESMLLKLENDIEGLTYKKAVDIINSNKISIELKEKEEELYNYSFEKIDSLYERINKNYDKLDERKREKIGKLLFEIEKILG